MHHPERLAVEGLDAETVQRIVASRYPAWEVDSVEPLSGGMTGAVFAIAPKGRRRHLVLKAYPVDWQMAHEAFVYELVASRTNVPVPEVLFTDRSRQTVDRSYLLMTRIDGEAPVSLRSLEHDDWRAIYRGMGEVLRALHEITFERFGYFTKGGFAESFQTNAEWMRKLFEQVLRGFAALGGPPSLERAVRDLVAGHEEVFNRCPTAVLCHNDLSEGNVLFSKGADGWRLTAVIDVGGSTAGDPLFDLAKTDYWSTRGNRLKRHALFDGYGPTRPDREEALRLYRPYHALELWNWFARDGRHPEMLARISEDLASLSLVKPS